jgi:hypothetical protein
MSSSTLVADRAADRVTCEPRTAFVLARSQPIRDADSTVAAVIDAHVPNAASR